MSMAYNYTAGQNNGRITSATDGVLNETVNYTYDSLNRLSTAQTTNSAWGQGFSYDGNGNLTGASVTAGEQLALAMFDRWCGCGRRLAQNEVMGYCPWFDLV